MRVVTRVAKAKPEKTDHAALRLMLSYVEAECLRIGALDAARHLAAAAALMPDTAAAAQAVAAVSRPANIRLN